MLFKAISGGDKLSYDPDYKVWFVTHQNGSMEGAPQMKIRISPDMMFVCDESGDITILKSSLKHYTVEQCISAFNAKFNADLELPQHICVELRQDPNLARNVRLMQYCKALNAGA